jgi:hypothetical protein
MQDQFRLPNKSEHTVRAIKCLGGYLNNIGGIPFIYSIILATIALSIQDMQIG